jgi:hypothetical protein
MPKPIKNFSAREQARQGLNLIEKAIIDHLTLFPNGPGKGEIARDLDLEFDGTGEQKSYLAWLILQDMAARKLVAAKPKPNGRLGTNYVVASSGKATTHSTPS